VIARASSDRGGLLRPARISCLPIRAATSFFVCKSQMASGTASPVARAMEVISWRSSRQRWVRGRCVPVSLLRWGGFRGDAALPVRGVTAANAPRRLRARWVVLRICQNRSDHATAENAPYIEHEQSPCDDETPASSPRRSSVGSCCSPDRRSRSRSASALVRC
jgi:hypothetical protein